jgi:hypothetical protein
LQEAFDGREVLARQRGDVPARRLAVVARDRVHRHAQGPLPAGGAGAGEPGVERNGGQHREQQRDAHAPKKGQINFLRLAALTWILRKIDLTLFQDWKS